MVDDEILCAKIILTNAPGGKVRYMASIMVSKREGTPGLRGAAEGWTFDDPVEALLWLRDKLNSAGFPVALDPPKS